MHAQQTVLNAPHLPSRNYLNGKYCNKELNRDARKYSVNLNDEKAGKFNGFIFVERRKIESAIASNSKAQQEMGRNESSTITLKRLREQ